MSFSIQKLPLSGVDFETKAILKASIRAHQSLAELKGLSQTIPNQNILINTLVLQEAQKSSEVENIITTQDEMFQSEVYPKLSSPAVKEVQRYSQALLQGWDLIQQNDVLLSSQIAKIQSVLETNNAGFRKLPGTSLKNSTTGEVIYSPPQNYDDIVDLMRNLECYINDETLSPNIDPLVKMAIIHHQFESIHPFYDGNGRTGRIINILYLVLKGLLDIPILYLSYYIIHTKYDYYRLLQAVRDENAWEEWVLYILKAIEVTAKKTIETVQGIKRLMQKYKHDIRNEFSFYTQDLLSNLFMHPYTKIDFLMKDMDISRNTALKYLDKLAEAGYLEKKKVWRHNYYINAPLFQLLASSFS